MEATVFSGFVIDWRLAGAPTSLSPSVVNATTEGVVLPPSEFCITIGSLPSMTETQEFVVPNSIPIILPLIVFDFNFMSYLSFFLFIILGTWFALLVFV